jgi:hypothetical protein
MNWWQIVLIIVASCTGGVLIGALIARAVVWFSQKRPPPGVSWNIPNVATPRNSAPIERSASPAPVLQQPATKDLRAKYSPPAKLTPKPLKPIAPVPKEEKVGLQAASARIIPPPVKLSPPPTRVSPPPARTSPPPIQAADQGRLQPAPAKSSPPPVGSAPANIPAPSTRGEPPRPLPPKTKSPLTAELESNLKLATQSWTGQVKTFTTAVWDRKTAEAEGLAENLQGELGEVYLDMRLANRLVWLAEDTGHLSPELSRGYLEMRDKIAERLRLIISSPHWPKT